MSSPVARPVAGSTITQGTYAAVPASPRAGDLHLCSDCELIRYYDGASWRDRLPQWGELTIPPSAGWSKVNPAKSTYDTRGPYRRIVPQLDAGLSQRLEVRAAPATPWVLRALVRVAGGEQRTAGIYLRESATGELIRWGPRLAAGTSTGMCAYHDTSPTVSIATIYANADVGHYAGGWWPLYLGDDGTDIYAGIWSPDGSLHEHWREGRTLRMAGGPDEIGWGGASTDVELSVELAHWMTA